jgi:glycosyltransferase involved in cell wall biosynthesis
VATAVGGLPTLLEGGAGVLVPPADPQALALALAGLMDDRERTARIARAGRVRIEDRYSFAGMVQRVETIYTDVLQSQARTERRPRRRAADATTAMETGQEAA